MNEYQERERAKYQQTAESLQLIVDELNKQDQGDVGEWSLMERGEEYDFTPRFICIEADTPDGRLELICERDGYGNKGRWEFRASGWPTYNDENGKVCTSDPSNLWNPKENRPVTTAAETRQPLAIAKQIVSKILGEYQRIHGRCRMRNEEFQTHSDERADGLRRLSEAAQDEDRYKGRHGSSFYIRNLPGDTVSVESRSHGDVQIRLHTDEMVEVIALLRKLRAGS